MEAAMGNEEESSSSSNGKRSWICTVVAADTTNFSYRVCSTCESTLPRPDSTACSRCTPNPSSPSSSKRLYRLLLSVATHESVTTVVLFDRSARVLTGCSADDLFSLFRDHPSAARAAGEALEGEMFRMTVSTPQLQQHPRVVSVVPLRAGFRPVVHALRQQQQHGCPKFSRD